MAGFLIYIPGEGGIDSVDVGHLLLEGDDSPVSAPCRRGPDGGRGQVWAWLDRVPSMAIDLERQTWKRSHSRDGIDPQPAGAYWLGTFNNSPVTPTDIARTETFEGLPVTLKDGNRWIVPRVDALPGYLAIENGEPVTVPEDRFADVHDRCQRIRDLYLAEEAAPMSFASAFHYATAFLSVAYRVNTDVVGMLRLVDGEGVATIIRAATVAVNVERVGA